MLSLFPAFQRIYYQLMDCLHPKLYYVVSESWIVHVNILNCLGYNV